MKIKTLINLLNKLPQDMEIEWWDAEWDIWYTIKNLKLTSRYGDRMMGCWMGYLIYNKKSET